MALLHPRSGHAQRSMVRALLLVLSMAGAPALAEDAGGAAAGATAPVEDVDPIALATLLIGDGHYDRAAMVLERVDESSEGLDRVRFHTLRGLVHLQLDRPAQARDDLKAAIAAGETRPVVHVYLAQAHYRLEEYRETLAALDAAGAEADAVPSLRLLEAEAHWRLGEPDRAWAVLETAERRFPDERAAFLRRKVFYLIDLELYLSAAELGREYLAVSEGSLEDQLAIGRALRQSGQVEPALHFLERALLTHPDDPRVAAELAHAYADADRPVAAADLLERAAANRAELLLEAAELHRRAGQRFRALNLNAAIVDQSDKLKQRLALLVELERWEMVAAMESGLVRTGLIEDGDIRYALAYSLFKTGAYDEAERQLDQLTDPDKFRQVVELRKAMESCRAQRWRCS